MPQTKQGPAEKKDEKNSVVIAARATDDTYNTQPEKATHLWNMRGVLNNAWHRVAVDLSATRSSPASSVGGKH